MIETITGSVRAGGAVGACHGGLMNVFVAYFDLK